MDTDSATENLQIHRSCADAREFSDRVPIGVTGCLHSE